MKTTEPRHRTLPDIPPESRVLCAVSGGADSVALLHLCRTLLEQGRLRALYAAHFHHGLRAAADEDERFVRELCESMGIECRVGRGDAGAEALIRGRGIEEAARALRYEFLEQCAAEAGADTVLTAHTADDQLETMLLNLTRGAGLDGLCGIPPRRGIFVRPLLQWTRAEILAYLERHGLPFREDESNADPRFRRNRIRLDVVPILRQINPSAAETAGRAAELLCADAGFLRALAETEIQTHAVLTDGESRFPAARLRELPFPIAARVLRALCVHIGWRDAALVHVEAMLALCAAASPHAEMSLPGGRAARRVYGELRVEPAAMQKHRNPSLQIRDLGLFQDANIYKSFNSFFVAGDTIVGSIGLRTRKSGDRIALPGAPGTRTLKKLMIDRKIPARERDNVPVVADEAGVIAVAGLGVDRSRLPRPGSRVLEVTIKHT